MLRSVQIKNFECLADTGVVTLEPITVLIGKNDTGKSSFLDALTMLRRLVGASDEPNDLETAPRALGSLRRRSTTEPMEWRLGWDATPGAYTLRVSVPDGSGRPSVVDESLDDEQQRFFGYDGRQVRSSISQTATEAPNSYPQLRGQRDAGLPAARVAIQRLSGIAAIALAEPSLAELTAVLDELLGWDRVSIPNLERDMRAAFPNFHELVFVPENKGKRLDIRLAPPNANGDYSVIPASQASGGVRAFLALLAEVYRPQRRELLLIEEPENGVHPRRLKLLAEHLKKLSASCQIIVATHSPYFLDYFAPECVRVFGRDKTSGEVKIRNMVDLPLVKEWIADGHSLGEMWFNVGEDRLLGETDDGAPRSE